MGAWDNGPFDNDEAADFIEDLAEAPDWRTVVRILEHVTRAAGYLEAPEGEMAVAAAAIVAACGSLRRSATTYWRTAICGVIASSTTWCRPRCRCRRSPKCSSRCRRPPPA